MLFVHVREQNQPRIWISHPLDGLFEVLIRSYLLGRVALSMWEWILVDGIERTGVLLGGNMIFRCVVCQWRL
jgi:hypothetical protein